mgnify:CR=1 FL=1
MGSETLYYVPGHIFLIWAFYANCYIKSSLVVLPILIDVVKIGLQLRLPGICTTETTLHIHQTIVGKNF